MHQLEKVLMQTSVLVVDDQRFSRIILGDMLRGMGVQQVHMAEDGLEGIKQFKTWLPSLVITDWNMSKMDGLEFTKWIRTSEDSPNPEIPIIMLTANNQQEQITQARDAGVSEIIIKPIVPSNVVERLTSVIFNTRKFVDSSDYCGPDRRRRQNKNFKGPMRRLTDPILVNEKSPEALQVVQDIHHITQEMMKAAKALDVTDRKQVLEIYNQAIETKKMALLAEDINLEQASASLSQYIETMGATGKMEGRVVDMHLQALVNLIHLPDYDSENRDAVVSSLLALVKKKSRIKSA